MASKSNPETVHFVNDQPIQIPEQPKEPPKGSRFKVFLVLVGILAVILIGGISYYLQLKSQEIKAAKEEALRNITPSPTPFPPGRPVVIASHSATSVQLKWQIYKANGFTFTYPANWEKPDGIMNNSEHVYFFDPKMPTNFIQLAIIQGSETAKEFIDKIQADNKNLIRKMVQISEYQVETYHINGASGTSGWYIPFANGKIIVTFGPLSTDPAQESIELDTIKTFQFLNPAITPITGQRS